MAETPRRPKRAASQAPKMPPAPPAGNTELSDEELGKVSGGIGLDSGPRLSPNMPAVKSIIIPRSTRHCPDAVSPRRAGCVNAPLARRRADAQRSAHQPELPADRRPQQHRQTGVSSRTPTRVATGSGLAAAVVGAGYGALEAGTRSAFDLDWPADRVPLLLHPQAPSAHRVWRASTGTAFSPTCGRRRRPPIDRCSRGALDVRL